MTAEHIPQIAAIEKICFPDPWSEDSFTAELEYGYSCWLVAVCGKTVAGYIGSHQMFEDADIMNIAVLPEYRRRNIGQRLLDAMFSLLAERGAETVALEVRPSNLPARALYEKNGFEQAGLRKNYYFHPTEDALILKKKLR